MDTLAEFEFYKKELYKRLSPKRFRHSLNVYQVAMEIAKAHGLNLEHVGKGALLHDIAKDMDFVESLSKANELKVDIPEIEMKNPALIHARLGAKILEDELNIEEPEVLLAVANHTAGKAGMSDCQLTVYIADYLDPEKKLKNYKLILDMAAKNLKEAALLVCVSKLEYVLESLVPFHPQSIHFYNWLLTRSS